MNKLNKLLLAICGRRALNISFTYFKSSLNISIYMINFSCNLAKQLMMSFFDLLLETSIFKVCLV